MELGTQYTADQLSGRAVLPEPLPLGERLQEHFLRQVRSLPPDAQAFALLAAADPAGDQGVLWRVAELDYGDEKDLYESARRVDWPRFFAVERTLRVNVSAQKSPLTSLDFATLRIKDAVCDRFRDALGSRPNVDRANPDVRVHAFLEAARGDEIGRAHV